MDRCAVVIGRGTWAPALRYHDGESYIFVCTPSDGLFMWHAKNPSGPWSETVTIKAVANWEDPRPFWDDDGRASRSSATVPKVGPQISIMYGIGMAPLLKIRHRSKYSEVETRFREENADGRGFSPTHADEWVRCSLCRCSGNRPLQPFNFYHQRLRWPFQDIRISHRCLPAWVRVRRHQN